jgi:2,3-bisphosphoglycerate-independent phosphoglycerate mutase
MKWFFLWYNIFMEKKDLKKVRQTMLVVLDGWGYRESSKDNAIAEADTPFFDDLWAKYPHALLKASGQAVGLPEGQMGNSEVGHTTIGAGKVVDTDLVRIGKVIAANELGKNSAVAALFEHVKKNNSTLHLQGLLGDGGVHAHSNHLFAILRAAKVAGIKKVALHVFTDGRDTPPQSASKYMKELEDVLQEVGIGSIATVSGRYYAMDRDGNWDRLSKAEQAIFESKGDICKTTPSQFVESLYKDGKRDEQLEPIVCYDADGKSYAIKEGDGVFFFNFRADRARMLTQKVIERTMGKNVCFVTMTQYNPEFKCLVAFPPISTETTLAGEISKAGLTQAHIAETEKFAHATYFLNGGRELPYSGEVHEMIPSHKDVPTHDLAPKMRAEAIADKAIEFIQNGTDFIFINFANADMVGHTANVPAIIEAVEEADKQLGRVVMAVQAVGGVAFITADHGNAEINIDQETGVKHTAHTTNPVPAIITDKMIKMKSDGALADVAPTVLRLVGIQKPATMTGISLMI